MRNKILFVSILLTFIANSSNADEGMWLPMLIKRLNYVDMQKAGLQLTPEEIYSVNNTSLKDAIVGLSSYDNPTNFFCTAEVISKDGLLLTNHHCAYDAIQKNSTVEHDYLSEGFFAKTKNEELTVDGTCAVFLERMEDVTDRVLMGVTNELSKTIRVARIKENTNKIIKEIESKDHLFKASIKSFFAGNEYYLFVYRVYKDVRLVGAPPSFLGKFGGDTDNWMWPRHTCDFSLLRIYADEKGNPAPYQLKNIPIKPKYHLPISLDGVKQDDYTMILGYPGNTERFLTSYGVRLASDVTYPTTVDIRTTKLGVMKEAMSKSPQIKLMYASKYASSANYWKYYIGAGKQLKRLKVFEKKKAIEDALTKWINENSERLKLYGGLVKDIENSYSTIEKNNKALTYLEEAGFQGPEIIDFAFQFSPLKTDLYDLLKSSPDDQLKIEEIINDLKNTSEKYFKDYDVQTDKSLFAALMKQYSDNVEKQQQPDILISINKKHKGNYAKYADKLFGSSMFTDKSKMENFLKKPSYKVLENDIGYKFMMSFIYKYFELASISEDAEESLETSERLFVDAVRKMNKEKTYYPDANSTMRITYGKVGGYTPYDAISYEYFTTFDGMIAKEDSSNEEFKITSKLKALYKKKDFGRYAENGVLKTCFITNTDITGGNSGSPVINAKGQLIGAAFDGNWEAMCGDISYESKIQRTIAVDIRYILFIIDKYAGAGNIINELDLVQTQHN